MTPTDPEEREQVLENTKNKERTIAWFIEVMMGCMFQTIFEDNEFKLCFGMQEGLSGYGDISNFPLTFKCSPYRNNRLLIPFLVEEVANFINQSKVINKVEPIAKKLLKEIIDCESHQIKYEGERLEELCAEILALMDASLITHYKKMVSNCVTKL